MKKLTILTTILLMLAIWSNAQDFVFIDLVYDRNIPIERYSFDRYENDQWLANHLKISEEGINIYPNPVLNYLINPDQAELSIYDALGRLMIKTCEKKVNVMGLGSGYYWVVSGEQKRLIIKK